ncbi:type 2 periplasmic-binding domain-containing protein [Chachezhania sediminis]|uniref:hypothetical protein n=1 Tax=Chachezhania sediminis TaxID=2599291 RepID=UPI00131B9911|nr:hypothetical protein [Chachezhania sediminis]
MTVEKATDSSDRQYLDQEAELKAFFEDEGLKVCVPDMDAFRDHAQRMYLESPLSQNWPAEMLDEINRH